MKISIRKLPTRPSRLVKKYITDINASDAAQATRTVFPVSTGVNPSNTCSAPIMTTA